MYLYIYILYTHVCICTDSMSSTRSCLLIIYRFIAIMIIMINDHHDHRDHERDHDHDQSSQDYILNFNQWCIDLSISPMCLSVISPRTHRFHHWRCRTASVQGRPRWGCFESLERKWPGLTGRGMPWAETQRIFISKAQALMMPVSSHGMPMAQVQSSSCRKRGPSPCQSLA